MHMSCRCYRDKSKFQNNYLFVKLNVWDIARHLRKYRVPKTGMVGARFDGNSTDVLSYYVLVFSLRF